MDKGQVAGKEPLGIELEAGKSYYWCACGKSNNQPWCDGSHKGTSFTPKVISVPETKTAWLCNCKQTNMPGFCDGSHKKL
jgi:CDGSH-type Zn-finger protein